ncbi:MAG: O-antigen ligase family protein [bacterium]|nr:O-antigen ligase family protein [bacterium]
MNEFLYPKTPAIVVECLLVALLLFTPLAFGTVQTWAISVLELGCLAMAAVWLVGFAIGGQGVRLRFPLGIPIALFSALVFAQLLPHIVGASSSSSDGNAWQKLSTTNFFVTKTAFIKLLCYVAFYLCLINTMTSRRQIVRVLVVMVLIGFAVSFLGLLQRISGTDKVFWLIKARSSRFMGAFINENHFAGYMELIIPLAIAFMLRHLLRIKESGWRGVVASEDLHKAILFGFLAIIMIVSVAVSQSRGGLIGLLGSLVAMAILLLCRQLHRRRAWVIVVLLTLSFLMLAWLGLSELLKTWGTFGDIPADSSFKRRVEVSEDTWRASKDYPIWGTGLGTFETVFPVYGTLEYRQITRDRGRLLTTPHAENDYVQSLLETGWVGMTICFVGLVLFFGIAIKTYLTRRRRSISIPAMGGAASVFAICVHSVCDFNLRIDANVFLLVTIVAMVMSLSRVERGHRRHSREERE